MRSVSFFAFVFTILPVNSGYTSPKHGYRLFLISNGVHTSICLPSRTAGTDWLQFLGLGENKPPYLCFGWGDRKFFIETPTWGDLTVSTALEALFWPTEGAMLVSPLYGIPAETSLVRPLQVDESTLESITEYIKKSFIRDSRENPVPIRITEGQRSKWGGSQMFFLATGKYDLFFTCNNWTNRALKRSGIRTSLWAPFDRSVLWHFRN